MCKRPPATPGSPSRTSGKDGQRSTTRGNARGIHVPPPGAWSDGTTHLLFEPVEFLEKLAVLTPRPAINQILYHGVLAPHADWRPAVVAYGRLGDAATAPPEPMGKAEAERGGAARSRYWTWAALMRRAFDLDVLRCPRCAGRMELIATVDDPAVTASSRTSVAHRLDKRGPIPNTQGSEILRS